MKRLYKIVMEDTLKEYYIVGFKMNDAICKFLELNNRDFGPKDEIFTENDIRIIENLGLAFTEEDFKVDFKI